MGKSLLFGGGAFDSFMHARYTVLCPTVSELHFQTGLDFVLITRDYALRLISRTGAASLRFIANERIRAFYVSRLDVIYGRNKIRFSVFSVIRKQNNSLRHKDERLYRHYKASEDESLRCYDLG